MHPTHRRSRSFIAGLSLVELLVVVGIVTIITVGLLVKHGNFNSATLLNNLAYDVALSIRQAQAYGISVRNAGGSNFSSGYGVSFDPDNPTSYVIFQDLDASNSYDHSITPDIDNSEFVERYNLRRGHTISKVCRVGGSAICFGSVSTGLTRMDIVFRRPNPDAIVNGSMSYEATIEVSSDDGVSHRTIHVLPTGQISISNP